MKQEARAAVYDEKLRVEAYCLAGMAQPFPAHFHAYYVIGLVEEGERRLVCKQQEDVIRRGDIVLFNPGDSHACAQAGGGVLDYRGFNIAKEVMLDLAGEVTGRRSLPGFSRPVVCDAELACGLWSLYELVMERSQEFDKEERLLLCLSLLLQRYSQTFEPCVPECRDEIERACTFMEQNYAGRICLDQICRCAGLSRSTLLRAFAKAKGVTPYRYLENIRIGAAKKLLEQGSSLVEAAMRTGFSDQSHFTNYFRLNILFLGLGASALCFVTWNAAVKLLGAIKTSVYIYLVPVITVAASVLILQEPFTWMTAAGTALTLAGLFLSESKPKKERAKDGTAA